MIKLVNADAATLPLEDGVVNLVVTSPSYWGLRSYEGNQVLVWGGGVSGCAHLWGEKLPEKTFSPQQDASGGVGGGRLHGTRGQQGWTGGTGSGSASTGQFCQHCNAWRGAFGLEPTPNLFIEHLVTVFREVRRVLHKSGLCFVNLGDSYAGGGRGSGRSHRQKMGKKTASAQGLGRKVVPDGLKDKDLCLVPQRAAIALQADGWWVRSFMPWPKGNALPESVRDRPSTSHEYWIMLAKSKKYFWDGDGARIGHKATSIKRWFAGGENTDNTKYEKDKPLTGVGNLRNASNPLSSGGRNRRTSDTWDDGLDELIAHHRRYLTHLLDIKADAGMMFDEGGEPVALKFNTSSYAGSHFATFPPRMIEPLVKAGSSERGVCSVCREPWVRVIEREIANRAIGGRGNNRDRNDGGKTCNADRTITTTGWRPNCNHAPRFDEWQEYPKRSPDEPTADYERRTKPIRQKRAELLIHWEPMETQPALVVDPFVGSGTTLQVARALDRDAIGFDLSFPYLAEQARVRLNLATALDVWMNAVKAGAVLELADLPLFAQMEGEWT